jgi:hypothetical protein
MSFGQSNAQLNAHIAELRLQRRRGQAAGTHVAVQRLRKPSSTVHLQDRIGLKLVEVGLRLMVGSRHASAATR